MQPMRKRMEPASPNLHRLPSRRPNPPQNLLRSPRRLHQARPNLGRHRPGKLRVADLETGACVFDDENMNWVYTTTTAQTPIAGLKVVAMVRDMPGHVVEKTLVL